MQARPIALTAPGATWVLVIHTQATRSLAPEVRSRQVGSGLLTTRPKWGRPLSLEPSCAELLRLLSASALASVGICQCPRLHDNPADSRRPRLGLGLGVPNINGAAFIGPCSISPKCPEERLGGGLGQENLKRADETGPGMRCATALARPAGPGCLYAGMANRRGKSRSVSQS